MYMPIRKSVSVAGSVLMVGTMIAFFGFHTIAGERGILARPELERKISVAEEQLMLLTKHQSHLTQRIALLRSDSLDADMLEETARAELGLYAPGDVIISIDLSDLKL